MTPATMKTQPTPATNVVPLRGAHGRKGRPSKSTAPVPLRDLLREREIEAMKVIALLSESGFTFSRSTFSHFVNKYRWPKCDREGLIVAIAKALAQFDVPLKSISAITKDLTAKAALQNVHHRALPASENLKPSPSLIDPLEKAMLTDQALAHFALAADPFAENMMRTREDVFLAADQRYIREAMYQAVKNGGFLAICGESGSGKTTLRHDLADRLVVEKMDCVVVLPRVVDKHKLTSELIIRAIIHDLDPDSKFPPNLEKQARMAEKLLINNSRAGNRCVLIIEEAQDLSKATLKYLKRFFELQDGFKKLLTIILIGQPELKRLLDERTNWDAREVIRRCEVAELLPFSGSALQSYVAHKFKRAGIDVSKVIDTSTYDAIRARLTKQRPGSTLGGKPIIESQLYPLVVNNLLTKAMNIAADLGQKMVTPETIKGV